LPKTLARSSIRVPDADAMFPSAVSSMRRSSVPVPNVRSVNINVSKEILSRGEVDLSAGGELLSRSTATVDVTINAPKGVVQSVKSKTTGDKDGIDLGLNMSEAF